MERKAPQQNLLNYKDTMKNRFFLIVSFLITLQTLQAQNDTICIFRNGVIIFKSDVNNIDSIVFNASQSTTYGSFIDIRDNTVYQTITIGTQTWMAQNLAYLPSVSSPSANSQISPIYYVHGYNGTVVQDAKATSNYSSYGVLYNWDAAMIACPQGWHLPTDSEWASLSIYLGGNSVSGGKLKETEYLYWNSPNTGATNSSGFNGRGGGYRDINGTFYSLGIFAYYWSSTEYVAHASYGWNLYNYNGTIGRIHHYKDYGFTVRCVMN